MKGKLVPRVPASRQTFLQSLERIIWMMLVIACKRLIFSQSLAYLKMSAL